MIETANINGVECWAVNTDLQALDQSLAPYTLKIGIDTSRGLGAGGKPEIGEQAA